MACTNFTDLVEDDNIAFEDPANFTIIVGNSTAWVQIVDDDSEKVTTLGIAICLVAYLPQQYQADLVLIL